MRGRAGRVAAAALALVLAVGLAGCGNDGPGPDAASAHRHAGKGHGRHGHHRHHRSPGSPAVSDSARVSRSGAAGPGGSAYSHWKLGAHPLPLRPDGYGVMRPTPKTLRNRRFPTTDLLPPPADGAFHSTIGPVTAAIRQRMGETWSPACPVGLAGLRYLTVSFRGYDKLSHTGELVVNKRVASDVVSVFRELFAADFPIEEMRLPTTADIEAHPTGDGNDTAALVCRATRGETTWSAHAYGLAIDVNPFVNPYHKGDVVLPELASSYLNRGWVRPGMAEPGSTIVRAFARIGWTWGGTWSSLKDYQHFSATGR